ncbi:MAG: hypothetical protein H8K04_10380 [Nitrospira sp.]
MSIPWWTKASPRRRKVHGKKTLRWDVLGLRDPAMTSATLSIEQVRRLIIEASNCGFSSATLARSQEKNGQRKWRTKSPGGTRKRRVALR